MPRKHIPDSLQASLLAANAGLCGVCKTRGVGTNFHHIDHNNANTEPKNIAVLCVRDHDAQHRPLKYPALNHLDLSANPHACASHLSGWGRSLANKPLERTGSGLHAELAASRRAGGSAPHR